MLKKIVVFFAIACGVFSINFADFNFRGVSSYVRVGAGSTFLLKKPLTINNGTLIKDAGGTISGATLAFVDGVYQDQNGSVAFNGDLDPLGTVTLNGKTMYITQVVQNLFIQGQNNFLGGSPQFTSDVVFQDSLTTLTVAFASAVNKNFVLNNGKLFLKNTLSFADGYQIIGPGAVVSNGYSLNFGAENIVFDSALTWSNAAISLSGNMTLTGQWTFYGSDNKFNGNGHLITLQGAGSIVVAPGSQLTLRSATINGIAGNNICCQNVTSTLILDAITWQQDNNYTFSVGTLGYKNNVVLSGNGLGFAFQSGQASKIYSQSTLTLDAGFTFIYDPCVVASKDLFTFSDVSSVLVVNGATFYVTGTGINLTKGLITVNNTSVASVEGIDGITVGDGTNVNNDCLCIINNNSQLQITQGSLNYKNKTPSPLTKKGTDGSSLRMFAGTNLRLYENLSIKPGIVYFADNTILAVATGKKLEGAVVPEGKLTRIKIS